MKRFAVILSGCGNKDGSEITETVSVLIALSELGAHYDIFAPDLKVMSVDHRSGEPTGLRSTLVESARLARGSIEDLATLKADAYDGLVFPGGLGAATHLSDFAAKGSSCRVLPAVETLIENFFKESKPVAAFCIAPVILARVLGRHGVTVTVGADATTAAEIRKCGAEHVDCAVDDFVTDRGTKVVTSPAYMYEEARPYEVFIGIRKAIREFYEMA